MSRNFELLRQAGGLHDLMNSVEEPENLPADNNAAASTPALELGGMTRDEVTKLVHRLFLNPGPQAPRRVVFTGAEAGDGCSWMCAHVGEVLASHVRGSVCMVDCNLRSPSLHRQFKTENHYGLSDALLGSDSIRQYATRLLRPNLWLVSCGAPIENGHTLLTSERMRVRMAELREEFDYLLIDVAPVAAGNEGLVLARLSDGVVLVLKANSSRRETAWNVLQELKTANVRALGAVLNQRTFPIPEAIYNWL